MIKTITISKDTAQTLKHRKQSQREQAKTAGAMAKAVAPWISARSPASADLAYFSLFLLVLKTHRMVIILDFACEISEIQD